MEIDAEKFRIRTAARLPRFTTERRGYFGMCGSMALMAVLMLAVTATGCRRSVRFIPTTEVYVTGTTSVEEVHQAVLLGAEDRNFVVESEQPGQALLRFDRRQTFLRLTVDYNADGYLMTYVDSEGLNLRLNADRDRATISRAYASYTRGLQRAIDRRIGGATELAPTPEVHVVYEDVPAE